MITTSLPRNLAALSILCSTILYFCLMSAGASSCGQKTPPSSAPPEYLAFLKQFDSLDVGKFKIRPKDFHRPLKAMKRSDAEQFLHITDEEWKVRASTRHPFHKGSASIKDNTFEYFGKFTCIPTVDACIVRSTAPTHDTVFILTTFDKTTGKPVDSQVIAESSTELGGEDNETPVRQMTTAEIEGFDAERAQEEGWQNAALHVTTTVVLQHDIECNDPQHVFYIRPDGLIEDHTLFVGSILGSGELMGYTAAATDIVPDINSDIQQYAGSYSFEYTYKRSRGGFTVNVSGDTLRVLYEETNGRLNHSQTMQEFANVLFGFNQKNGSFLIDELRNFDQVEFPGWEYQGRFVKIRRRRAYGVWQGKEETEEIRGLQFGSYIFTRSEERRDNSAAQQSSFHCDSVDCGRGITVALTDIEEDRQELEYGGRYQYSDSGQIYAYTFGGTKSKYILEYQSPQARVSHEEVNLWGNVLEAKDIDDESSSDPFATIVTFRFVKIPAEKLQRTASSRTSDNSNKFIRGLLVGNETFFERDEDQSVR